MCLFSAPHPQRLLYLNRKPHGFKQYSQSTSKQENKTMFQIIEVFLGFSIGVAILWVTVLALVKFTRRVISGEEWQDVLKDLWKKRVNGVLPAHIKPARTESNTPINHPEIGRAHA